MNSLDRMIRFSSGKYHKRLQALTSPLRDYFGIDYFFYQKINPLGEWVFLGNRPDWLEYSASEEFYRHDPSLIHPDKATSGIFLPDLHEDSRFQDTFVAQAKNKFQLQNALVITKKSRDYSESFVYASRYQQNQAYTIYFNHEHIFNQYFPSLFKKQTLSLIQSLEEESIDLDSLLKGRAHHHKGVLANGARTAHEFLYSLSNNEPDLTERELLCVQYYYLGKSAKQSALLLGLSHRTVEEHLNNAKNKFQLCYKHQLLTHPKVLCLLHILPPIE